MLTKLKNTNKLIMKASGAQHEFFTTTALSRIEKSRTPLDRKTAEGLTNFDYATVKAMLKPYPADNALGTVGIKTTGGFLRIWFERHDSVWIGRVYSARTLECLKQFGTVVLSRAEMSALPEDPYNDLILAEAAFNLFGLSICRGE